MQEPLEPFYYYPSKPQWEIF